MNRMKIAAVAVSLPLVLSTASAVQPTASQPSSEPSVDKRILPWVELNYPEKHVKSFFPEAQVPPHVTMYESVVTGMAAWKPVTKTIIVTTTRTRIKAVYGSLIPEAHELGMTVIGGVKTNEYFAGWQMNDSRHYDVANSRGWKAVANDCDHIARLTGNSTVLLECESLFRKYREGKKPIDPKEFAEVVRPLAAKPVHILWWWPMVASNASAPELRDRLRWSAELVKAVHEAVPSSRFLHVDLGWRWWTLPDHPERPRRVQSFDAAMRILGPEHYVPLLYATADGLLLKTDHARKRNAYDVLEAKALIAGRSHGAEAIEACRDVVIYPGMRQWVQTAEAWASGR